MNNNDSNELYNSDFDSLKISLASPQDILRWSNGEVTKPETINYRTQRPERDGLCCEKIFGPVKDWTCYCGKYKGIRFKGVVCDKCGVTLTRSLVRRERMGHISLHAPVSHIWFLRGLPSCMGQVLDISVRDLESVIYFANFIITSVDNEKLDKAYQDLLVFEENLQKVLEESENSKDKIEEIEGSLKEIEQKRANLNLIFVKSILGEVKLEEIEEQYPGLCVAQIGAEAIQSLLSGLDLAKLIAEINNELENAIPTKKKRLLRRLRLIEGMHQSNINPAWSVLTTLPVCPPDLRPMVQLDGGRFATSDLNDLYRRVINRNNRLKKLINLGAPDVIVRNEKRMLQESVDALIDNNVRRDRVAMSANNRKKLKSLTEILKGKQGRFRQNLLGKRVDYSGRSVIVVGPRLKMNECGIPKTMALELFKPMVLGILLQRELATNVRAASRMIERGDLEVWDCLEEAIREKYVLLNRAPTLHRLSIQAFKPILIEGKAIQLHPLVCAGFNADFDGDQMAVHVPLSHESQAEAKDLMLPEKNLLRPANGDPIIKPDQDMILGCYYLTVIDENLAKVKIFSSEDDAISAYQNKIIGLHQAIKCRIKTGELSDTTVGRIIFNQILPLDYPYINKQINKKELKNIVFEIFHQHGSELAAHTTNAMKDLGFEYSTQSGITFSLNDLISPAKKDDIIKDTVGKIDKIKSAYNQGLITKNEKYEQSVVEWDKASEQIKKILSDSQSKALFNDITMIIGSGSRGNISQANQIGGMLGLVADTLGKIIELPIRGNYKDGLSAVEFFISSHGSRKGMTNRALNTAEAGYLTRKLIDVGQDMVITGVDCGTKETIWVIRSEVASIDDSSFTSWLESKLSVSDIKNAKGQVIVASQEYITNDQANKISQEESIDKVEVRSSLKCAMPIGICQKCYGLDIARGGLVNIGEAVGIVAAQSIGEPATQLTMDIFHSGGVAGSDITQGLPRVEEILEVRNPKGQAIISEISGVVNIDKQDDQVIINVAQPTGTVFEYQLEKDDLVIEKEGDLVEVGDSLVTRQGQIIVRAPFSGAYKVLKSRIEVISSGAMQRSYQIAPGLSSVVKDGDEVQIGQRLTSGSINLQELLELTNIEKVEKYIITEVQKIYLAQGENITTKHLELIVRQMFSRVIVEDAGDSDLIYGDTATLSSVMLQNLELVKLGKKLIQYRIVLMPISKISTTSDSWLAAASFQDTVRVLISAALSSKTDDLRGLKENVIIGRLIPAGTGYESSKLSEISRNLDKSNNI